jgi:hypothetical protein
MKKLPRSRGNSENLSTFSENNQHKLFFKYLPHDLGIYLPYFQRD